MTTKRELQKQWEAVNNTLTDLADLRCWPAGKDVADIEGELLTELDEIEYESGEDLRRQGSAQDCYLSR